MVLVTNNLRFGERVVFVVEDVEAEENGGAAEVRGGYEEEETGVRVLEVDECGGGDGRGDEGLGRGER